MGDERENGLTTPDGTHPARDGDRPKGPLFPFRACLATASALVGLIVAGWAVSQVIDCVCGRLNVYVDIHRRWPLSMVHEMIPGVHAPWYDLGISAGVVILFFVFVRWFARQVVGSLLGVLLAGFVFVLCTNLIHGPRYGLVHPQLGDQWVRGDVLRQYYHDAGQIASAGEFLRQFESRQEELTCHARTHPPGAVLFYYALMKTVGHPAAISLAIAVISVGLSGVFFYRLLSRVLDRRTCGYVTLLFLLIPSIQIYYCATLDAVIAGCFLGVVFFMGHRRWSWCVAGSVFWLFGASFLTFGACFLLPVMAGFEWITRRSLWRSSAVILGVCLLYLAVYLAWGFNYLGSFTIASALENPQGFRLITEPVSYFMTRLENVVTILVFFGPFLLVLSVRGWRAMRRTRTLRELLVLTNLGVLTLLAMFLAGTFRTGETARACLFIYPYLMFPVAAFLQQGHCRESDKRTLLWLVFGQTIAMQTLGGYFW